MKDLSFNQTLALVPSVGEEAASLMPYIVLGVAVAIFLVGLALFIFGKKKK